MTPKTSLHCLEDIPNVEALATNFSFISELVLRENIAIVLQYIIFLINLEKSHSLPGAVSYLIYKDMIIQTASITEALLCYGLNEAISRKMTTLEVVDIPENKFKDFKSVFAINPYQEAGAVIKSKSYKKPDDMQFNDLIPAARHAGLVDDGLAMELDDIRKLRNRIHLVSFSQIDNGYTMAQVDDIFKTVYKLKQKLIRYLATQKAK